MNICVGLVLEYVDDDFLTSFITVWFQPMTKRAKTSCMVLHMVFPVKFGQRVSVLCRKWNNSPLHPSVSPG